MHLAHLWSFKIQNLYKLRKFVVLESLKFWFSEKTKNLVMSKLIGRLRQKFWAFSEFSKYINLIPCRIDSLNKCLDGQEQSMSCDGFLRRTHAPRTSRSRFARTRARTPILCWSHFAPAPAPF